jgi:hypothetical protein
MKMCLVVFVGMAVLADASAGLSNRADTKQLSDQIMKHFLIEEFDEGVGKARPHWPLPPEELDGLVKQINDAWKIVRTRCGETTGLEFIREDRIGTSFVRYYYLHKFKNHAIYWEFVYYKPDSEWIVNRISFKDDLDFLFKTVE